MIICVLNEMIHHLAGHIESSKDHTQRELEAEAVAHVVCRHFGFEDLKSPNILYLTGLKAKDLKARQSTISSSAHEFIVWDERISI